MFQLELPWWAEISDEETWCYDDAPVIRKKWFTLYEIERKAMKNIQREAAALRLLQANRFAPPRLSTLENELYAADLYLITARDSKGDPMYPHLGSEWQRASWIAGYINGEVGSRQIMEILNGITTKMIAWDALGVVIPQPLPMLPVRAKARVRRAA